MKPYQEEPSFIKDRVESNLGKVESNLHLKIADAEQTLKQSTKSKFHKPRSEKLNKTIQPEKKELPLAEIADYLEQADGEFINKTTL